MRISMELLKNLKIELPYGLPTPFKTEQRSKCETQNFETARRKENKSFKT